MLFNLDAPSTDTLTNVTRFGGWYIPEPADHARLQIWCDGRPLYALSSGHSRPDVKAAFPNEPDGLKSGFFGDLYLSAALPEAKCSIQIVDVAGDSPRVLCDKQFSVDRSQAGNATRRRQFNLQELLRCPDCGKSLEFGVEHVSCQSCKRCWQSVRGTPHFIDSGELPFLRLGEPLHTHDYGENAVRLLSELKDGLILDFGAGNTPTPALRPNVVYLDVQQYANTDVVAMTARLPFADNTFDGVISQAVFEHLPDPHGAAKELHRVLKPGGIVYVDTAFMQPLHGDPSHYFNMTVHGLRRVMSGFEEIRTGVAPYQAPSFGLAMQIEQVLPMLSDAYWIAQLTNVKTALLAQRESFDHALGTLGRNTLAAGYFFEGRKSV